MKKGAFGVAAAALLAACGDGGGETDRAKLSVIQAEIFTPTCAVAGCHSGAVPGGGLDLTAGNARGNLVGVDSVGAPGEKRVAAGDPGASVLAKVLEAEYQTIPRMPSGMPKLPQADIDAITDWIANGAPND